MWNQSCCSIQRIQVTFSSRQCEHITHGFTQDNREVMYKVYPTITIGVLAYIYSMDISEIALEAEAWFSTS